MRDNHLDKLIIKIMFYPDCGTEETVESNDDGTMEGFIGQKYGKDGMNSTMPKQNAFKVAKYAIKKFRGFVRSDTFQILQEAIGARRVAQLAHSQLELGEMLGEGGFSNVFAIKKSLSSEVAQDKYVIKTLPKRILKKPTKFAASVVALAKEGAILGLVDHPNIIKLRGTSFDGLWRIASGHNDAYFLVLDRLEETLTDRLDYWRNCIRKRSKKNLRKFLSKIVFQKQKKQFIDQFVVGTQVAAAVSYLHEYNILHRDLKPANIGFDQDRNVKLFDFNVSRLLPKPVSPDQTFALTMTGTPRYMSPECGLGRPYNLKSDVYNFALLLHEILSLEVPFKDFTRQEHTELVLKQGCERPHIPSSWPTNTKYLIQKSWSDDLQSRPTMKEIHKTLTNQLSHLDCGHH